VSQSSNNPNKELKFTCFICPKRLYKYLPTYYLSEHRWPIFDANKNQYQTSRMTDVDQSTTRASSADSASSTERNEQGRGKPTATNGGLKGCRKRLQRDAETIELLGRLYGHGATLVDAATCTLTTEHTSRESIVYQSFLQDILRHAGPGFVVLCAASLGKRRVIQLNAQDRVDLIRHIRDNKAELHSTILDSLAIQHNVPSLNGRFIRLY
jgi:hypothetical protein